MNGHSPYADVQQGSQGRGPRASSSTAQAPGIMPKRRSARWKTAIRSYEEIAGDTLAARFENNLRDNNVVSQRGLVEMFDSTIGATVLMPFGGRTQGSRRRSRCRKLPTDGYTDTASIMAPVNLSLVELPRRGAYAVVEAAAKVVAAGARYDRMRYSYQEYFERMTRIPNRGASLGALLGALKMQVELGLRRSAARTRWRHVPAY